LQLTELRAAEPSGLGPVENHQNRLLALEQIQVHRRTLNRKSGDVWGHLLNLDALQAKQQSEN